jgi:hypothetical protein
MSDVSPERAPKRTSTINLNLRVHALGRTTGFHQAPRPLVPPPQDDRKNVAKTFPRLSLVVIETSISVKRCFLSHLAKSTHVTAGFLGLAFKKMLARSAHLASGLRHNTAPARLIS